MASALADFHGADLSQVRMHADENADRICRALSAEAATVGADVFFAAGAFAPHSRAGLRLLVHETAHAVQQAGARRSRAAGASVSDPADDCESAARSLADAFLRGGPSRQPAEPVRPLADSEQLVVQRHASWEHRLLGDALPADLDAITMKKGDRKTKLEELKAFLEMWRDDPDAVTPEAIKGKFSTIRTLRLGGSGLLVTYGELNTLADYLANPAALDSQPKAILEPILQAVRQDSYLRVNKLLGTPVQPGSVHFKNSAVINIDWDFFDLLIETMALDDLTKNLGPKEIDHYGAVVGRNACHFAPYSWYRWEQSHLIARDYATQAHHASGTAKERLTYLAWINHGYADHFLQDSFAAGHLVNKTLVMQWFVEWAAGQGKLMPVADWKMVQTMTVARQSGLAARGLYDGFLDPAKRGAVRDPQTADEQWSAQRRMDVAGVKADGTRSQGDAYKHYLTLMRNSGVQMSSGVLHDNFNKTGLYVASVHHPAAFEIYGDSTMLDGGDGVRIASETAQLSQQSILDLIAHGATSITTAEIFNRFPTSVRGTGNSMLSLEAWNDSQRDTATGLFASFKIAGIRAASPRIRNISIDTTGGWRWVQVPGEASDIAVGGDGSVWTITKDQKIQRLEGNSWVPLPGGGARIAVDGSGTPWVASANRGIWRWDGRKWEGIPLTGIPLRNDSPGEQVAGDIGAGADGSVWITGRTDVEHGHPILRWTGQKWEQAAGAAVAISVAPSGLPWIANKEGGIARLNPGGPLGSGWGAVPGLATDIAVSTGVLPTVWAIGAKKAPGEGGNEILAWNGQQWDVIPGSATRIAVGPDGTPWVVNAKNAIFHLVPADESRVVFTTADGGKVKGKAVATSGSLFPGDMVEINGSIDLSKVIVGNSGACVHSIKLDTSAAYYDYVLEVDAQGPKGFGSGLMYLRFVDEEGDVYTLSIYLSDRKQHTLRYDSNLPGIKEIRWSDSLF
ncbi:tectonin domain-containing protein [Actinoallomurus vinaceus]|uniref:tectonin domain-containing protein n=1 Tax=Actinoallomurus vinaceus TaxID=1080074 RepID=UPI0031EAE2B7